MNIRELDEESRRTGVWPPRRIILRVDREETEGEAPAEAQAAAPVKVAEVDLTAPRAASAPPKPKPAPAPLAPSLSPSVTPSRRPGLPGARGVTPAPAVSREDAEFEKWIAEPLPKTDSEPEFQPPPAWLPDDVRVRAQRRHRRVARKSRTQLFGASAATTLAVGGCAAVVALVGLSQTESVGGKVGAPNIGLFGPRPEPPKPAETADRAPAKQAAKKPARSESRRRAARRERRTTPAPARNRSSAPARSSAPSASRAPVARATNPPPAARPRAQAPAPSPPPPPAPVRRVSPPPPPTTSPPQSAVFDAPSQPAGSNTAPSRPAGSTTSRPAPTTSSPAP